MRYVLGIDTSTTATKAVLVGDDGAVAATGVAGYDFSIPHHRWSEQDPELWWNGTVEAIRSALSVASVTGEEVAAIGLAGQMHGLVLLDEDDQVLRPAILWNDQRTAAECDEIRSTIGLDRLVAITGNDALSGFTAPKILWVRKHEPEVYSRAKRILLPKDYVRLRLTGDHISDKAGGSGTQLFDLAARDWSAEILDALDISAELLPPTIEGTTIGGSVTHSAARATGLAPGTPVVGGGGDQAAAAVGTGAIEEGVISLSLGTSGVVFGSTATPTTETAGRVHAFCHAVPDTWHLMGVMLSAAGSLRWFRDVAAPDTPFDQLAAEAGAAPAGSDGLLFLPYLTGERTPHADPNARGAFIGLTAAHERPALTRSVLEGVAFGLRDILDVMRTSGIAPVDQIRITGGGTKSPVWRQILADVLDTDLVSIEAAEGASFGAAMLAAVGCGWFADPAAACASWVRLGERTAPSADAAMYTERHNVYKSLYPALKPMFDAS